MIRNKQLKMQTCNVFKAEDSNWLVRDNEIVLDEFPGHYTNNEMASIIDFAKKYESKAFLIGQEDAMLKEQAAADIVIYNLKLEIQNLVKENERLSTKLEQLIIGSEE